MSEQKSLCRDDQLKLEAYRSLNLCNDHDGKILIGLDTVVLALVGITIFNEKMFVALSLPWVFLGIGLPIPWLLLSRKFLNRQRKRYELMREIECCLGFSAHRAIYSLIESKFLQKITFFHVRLFIAVCLWLAIGYIICKNLR